MIERSPRAHARFANGCGTRTSQTPRLAGPRDFDIEWFFLSLHRETFTGEVRGFPALNLRRFGHPRRVRTRGPCEFDSRPLFPGMNGASSAAGERGPHLSRAQRSERIAPRLPRRCRRDRRDRPSLWNGGLGTAAGGVDSLPAGRARWRSRRPCSPVRESRTPVGSAAVLAPESSGSVDSRACSLLVLRRDPILPFGAFAPTGPREREAGCGPEELCSQPRPTRRQPAELVTSPGRCIGKPGPAARPESPSMEKAPRVHDARGLLGARLIPPARGRAKR